MTPSLAHAGGGTSDPGSAAAAAAAAAAGDGAGGVQQEEEDGEHDDADTQQQAPETDIFTRSRIERTVRQIVARKTLIGFLHFRQTTQPKS